jgi:hypothetical protein
VRLSCTDPCSIRQYPQYTFVTDQGDQRARILDVQARTAGARRPTLSAWRTCHERQGHGLVWPHQTLLLPSFWIARSIGSQRVTNAGKSAVLRARYRYRIIP